MILDSIFRKFQKLQQSIIHYCYIAIISIRLILTQFRIIILDNYQPMSLKIIQDFRVSIRDRSRKIKFSKIRLAQELHVVDYHQDPLIIRLQLQVGKYYRKKNQLAVQNSQYPLPEEIIIIIDTYLDEFKKILWVYQWFKDINFFGVLSGYHPSLAKLISYLYHYPDNHSSESLDFQASKQLCEHYTEQLIIGLPSKLLEQSLIYISQLIDFLIKNENREDHEYLWDCISLINLYPLQTHFETLNQTNKQPTWQVQLFEMITKYNFVKKLANFIQLNQLSDDRISSLLQFCCQMLFFFNRINRVNSRTKDTFFFYANQYPQLLTEPIINIFEFLNFQRVIQHSTNKRLLTITHILSYLPLTMIKAPSEKQSLLLICQYLGYMVGQIDKQSTFEKERLIEMILKVINEQIYSSDGFCYIIIQDYVQTIMRYLLDRTLTKNIPLLQHNVICNHRTPSQQHMLKCIPKLFVNCLVNELHHNCESNYYQLIGLIATDIPTAILHELFGSEQYMKESQHLFTNLLNTRDHTLKKYLCEQAYETWRVLEMRSIQSQIRMKICMLCYQMNIGDEGYLQYWSQQQFRHHKDFEQDLEQILNPQ